MSCMYNEGDLLHVVFSDPIQQSLLRESFIPQLKVPQPVIYRAITGAHYHHLNNRPVEKL